jgi:hypothetical protein
MSKKKSPTRITSSAGTRVSGIIFYGRYFYRGGLVNTFNRIVMILLTLLLFFAVTVGLVMPKESLQIVGGGLSGTIRTLDRIRPEFILPFRALLILCALFVDALLAGLLVLELRGPAKHSIHVRRVGGGEVIVTADSIAQRVQYHVDQLADVVGVRAQVKPRGGGVELELHLQTGADVNVPEKAEQVLQVARQVVEEKMGLVLAGKPRVHIQVMAAPALAVKSPARAIEPAQPSSDRP